MSQPNQDGNGQGWDQNYNQPAYGPNYNPPFYDKYADPEFIVAYVRSLLNPRDLASLDGLSDNQRESIGARPDVIATVRQVDTLEARETYLNGIKEALDKDLYSSAYEEVDWTTGQRVVTFRNDGHIQGEEGGAGYHYVTQMGERDATLAEREALHTANGLGRVAYEREIRTNQDDLAAAFRDVARKTRSAVAEVIQSEQANAAASISRNSRGHRGDRRDRGDRGGPSGNPDSPSHHRGAQRGAGRASGRGAR